MRVSSAQLIRGSAFTLQAGFLFYAPATNSWCPLRLYSACSALILPVFCFMQQISSRFTQRNDPLLVPATPMTATTNYQSLNLGSAEESCEEEKVHLQDFLDNVSFELLARTLYCSVLCHQLALRGFNFNHKMLIFN